MNSKAKELVVLYERRTRGKKLKEVTQLFEGYLIKSSPGHVVQDKSYLMNQETHIF